MREICSLALTNGYHLCLRRVGAGGEGLEIGDHHIDYIGHGILGLPAEFFGGFGGVGSTDRDVRGPVEEGIGDDMGLPVEAEGGKGSFNKLGEGIGAACGDDVVLGLVLLEHAVHRFDVLGSPAPVPLD